MNIDKFTFRVWNIDGNYPGNDKCVGIVESLKFGRDLYDAAVKRHPGEIIELRNKAMVIRRIGPREKTA